MMLAEEKSAKSAALADLDALQNIKHDSSEADALRKELELLQNKAPDTSEVDDLRKEIELLQRKHNSELAASTTALEAAKTESGSISDAHAATKLALEKVLADLDACKAMKPDTSEADVLKAELQSLTEAHEHALTIAQQTARQATSEHLAVKLALEKAQADAVTSQKTFQADYKDLSDSMTQLLEEATAQVKSHEARLEELEAQLKVKDAEIAEEKVLFHPGMFPN